MEEDQEVGQVFLLFFFFFKCCKQIMLKKVQQKYVQVGRVEGEMVGGKERRRARAGGKRSSVGNIHR